jgi:hypothetical protein
MVNRILIGGLAVILTIPNVRAESSLERSAYLVKSVASSGICRSPVDQVGNPNGPELSGGPATLSSVFVAYPPNLTPDTRTGLGSWSDDQIITAFERAGLPMVMSCARQCRCRFIVPCRIVMLMRLPRI